MRPVAMASAAMRSTPIEPVLIEPVFYLTCCLIWSSEFPLTLAAEGVKKLLVDFLKVHIAQTKRPGAVWVA